MREEEKRGERRRREEEKVAHTQRTRTHFRERDTHTHTQTRIQTRTHAATTHARTHAQVRDWDGRAKDELVIVLTPDVPPAELRQEVRRPAAAMQEVSVSPLHEVNPAQAPALA